MNATNILVEGMFRNEVLDAQKSSQFGDVFLSVPLKFSAIIFLIAVLVSGIVAFALVGEYTRKERVVGFINSDKGLVNIIPTQGGRYDKVFVSVGDFVSKGDPLLQISSDLVMVNGSIPAEALVDAMNKERQSLIVHMNEIPEHYHLKTQRIKISIRSKLAEASRLDAQMSIEQRSIEIEKSLLKKMTDLLGDQAVSEREVATQESRYLEASQKHNRLIDARAKILSEVDDARAEILLIPHEQEDEENSITERVITLEKSIISTSAQGGGVINSPVAGRVASVKVKEGQSVSLLNRSLAIIPNNSKLQAEVFVPTRAAGFMQPGQKVILFYDAFPFQKFGVYEGRIEEISKTVIETTDLPISQEIQEPVFLVTISLSDQSINAGDQTYQLQSGMTLTADIVLEKRKVWEWAFEPLIGALRQ